MEHQPERLADLLADSPYEPIQFLGRGGVGDVFVVEHRFLGRRFVLKLLRSRFASDPQFLDRLRVEAQTMARLRHPNVVDVVDFRTAKDGTPYVIMELLHGRTLDQELVARGQMPVDEAVEFASEALSALGAAHAAGVVHRDVKPENLFLHEMPSFPRVLKVLDFGFARVLPDASERALVPVAPPTRTGSAVGSPRFMSPESARGEQVDHRADLYSLGLVLYFALVGHGPWDVGSFDAAPPSQYASGYISPRLDYVVLRAIRDSPDERYQNAEEFLKDLQPFRPPHQSGKR